MTFICKSGLTPGVLSKVPVIPIRKTAKVMLLLHCISGGGVGNEKVYGEVNESENKILLTRNGYKNKVQLRGIVKG
jgi:hypothetical protein